jgi:hypothetical protein
MTRETCGGEGGRDWEVVDRLEAIEAKLPPVTTP